MSDTLRSPSQSCKTSTAIWSGASTRSGARITQTSRVASNFNLACRGSFGRLCSLTLMLRLAIASSARFGHEGPRRNVAVDIGMIERVELHPQHVGLEDQRVADRLALGRCRCVLLDIIKRKAGVARRLRQPPLEIAHDVGIDEVVVLQHAGDALFV